MIRRWLKSRDVAFPILLLLQTRKQRKQRKKPKSPQPFHGHTSRTRYTSFYPPTQAARMAYDLRRDNPLFDERFSILCTSPSVAHSHLSHSITTTTSSDESYDMNINLKILTGFRGYQNGNQQEKILYFEVRISFVLN